MLTRRWATSVFNCALLGLLIAPSRVQAQTDAEPVPATRPTVTAKKLLAAAYEKTLSAQSVDDFSHIIEQCERALGVKLSPENATYAHQLAGWAYNKRGEAYASQAATMAEGGEERKANELDDVALADFESALAHDPQKWRALHNRGVSRALRDRIDEALTDFDKVIELNPAFLNVWFNRAELLARQGKYAEAAADYGKALELKTDDVGSLLGRGNALLREQKFHPALADFNKALQYEPDNAQALAGRGDVRTAIGQWEEAADDYRQAIKRSTKLGRAYRGAAWLMATCPDDKFRDAELAVASAREALQLDGNGDYAYLDTLAAALANAGNFEDARAAQEKAIHIAPDAVIAELRSRLALYAAEKPYRAVSRTVRGTDDEQLR